MDHAILVLNAGSSSLKFAVYKRSPPEGLRLEARGQIEGLGTSPRFTSQDRDAKPMVPATFDTASRSFGHPEAFAALVAWLRKSFGAAMSLAAVGHRVVHGGPDFAGPTLV